MTKYFVHQTDINKDPIEVDEGAMNDSALDVALFGRIRLEYGERLNQNLLNLLENFSAGGDPSKVPVTPTPMPSPSVTPSGMPVSATPTPTVTRTITPTASVTATVTPTPTSGAPPTPTPTETATVTPTVTVTPTIGVSPTPTLTPTVTPSPTPAIGTLNLIDVQTYVGAASGTGSWCSIDFNADGSWITDLHWGTSDAGTWLIGGTGGDFEMFYTFFDGSTEDFVTTGWHGDNGPGAGVWHNMGGGIQFSAADSGATTEAALSYGITVRSVTNPAYSQSMSLVVSADGGCFAVGTNVLTSNGLVAVENLQVGDTVSSFNVPSMIDESQPNWRGWNTTDISALALGNSTVTDKRIFTSGRGISINGLVSTVGHVYFVCDNGTYKWKNANTVTLNDKLVNSAGQLIDITEIVYVAGTQFVALNVETDDTLIVENDGEFILTHNLSA